MTKAFRQLLRDWSIQALAGLAILEGIGEAQLPPNAIMPAPHNPFIYAPIANPPRNEALSMNPLIRSY